MRAAHARMEKILVDKNGNPIGSKPSGEDHA